MENSYYKVGTSVWVKCDKGVWKNGTIERIRNGWMHIRIAGYKTLKRVSVNWFNMYF